MMTNPKPWILGGAAGLLLLAGAAFESRSVPVIGVPEGVTVGEEVSYRFRTAPRNARGAQSLEDFRGAPLLVEFWGTR